MKYIRNFSIIAHVDHGKSTLSERLIEYCTGNKRGDPILDSMVIERERGITIKAKSITLTYRAKNKLEYLLNFIDTPGHVDFSYEVSRSLAACEGALLVVDASQGVEAQTVANCCTAIDQGLEVIPVISKIDLPQSDPDRIIQDIEEIIGIDAVGALKVSGKTGFGIEELLEQIVRDIPPPQGSPDLPLQALIIDSWFDPYVGVVSLVRVKNGQLQRKDKIRVFSTGQEFQIEKLGIFSPTKVEKDILHTGEVGFIYAGMKAIDSAPVGDTLTSAKNPAEAPLPGFCRVQPRVFSGMYPVNSEDFEGFREALAKLQLNDAALFYEPESSQALGFGFRCGFLGMLHMEIVQERLEREYHLDLITTAPTVVYEVVKKNQEILKIDNPVKLPDISAIQEIREPIVEAHILVPQTYIGNVITLCIERRGVQIKMHYAGTQVSLVYELPMSEVALDFFDQLKSVSKGYASLEYNFKRFQEASLSKMDILINGEPLDALSLIVHNDQLYRKGRDIVERMKEVIPRQLFDVAVQAAIGGKIISRTTVKALRKNVTAKCYGGDITRKRKLLEKQKRGKKRMKQIGQVEIPQEAFLAVLQSRKGEK